MAKLLWILLMAVPAAFSLLLVLRYSVDVPFQDDWHTPGWTFLKIVEGELRIEDIIALHNESRKVFPRLLWIALGSTVGWTVTSTLIVSWLITCGMVIGCASMVRGSVLVKIFAAGVMSLLLFSPVHYDNQTWAIMLVSYMVQGCVIACLWLQTTRLSYPRQVILCSVFALLATYSYINGVWCWIAGAPVMGLLFPVNDAASFPWRRRLFWFGGYAAVATVVLSVYFYFLVIPAHHTETMGGTPSLGDVIAFFFTWLGAPFVWGVEHRSEVVIVGAALFVAVAIGVISLRELTRAEPDGGRALLRQVLPWVMLCGYGFASGATVTYARIGLGVEAAFPSRYSLLQSMAWVGAIGLGTVIWSHCRRKQWLLRAGTGMFALGVAILTFVSAKESQWMWQETRYLKLQDLLTVRLLPHFTNNPAEEFFLVDPNYVRMLVPKLRDAGILKIQPLKNSLPELITSAQTIKDAGFFTLATIERGDVLVGAALVPDEQGEMRPADYVLVAVPNKDGKMQPVTGLAVGLRRWPLIKRYGSNVGGHCGFSTVFPFKILPAVASLQFYAVDSRRDIAYHLKQELPEKR